MRENYDEFCKALLDIFPYQPIMDALKSDQKITLPQLQTLLIDEFKKQIGHFPEAIFGSISRMTLLRHLDVKWMDQLHNMDALREGIGLRAYGQRDPLIEYKVEGFQMFKEMIFNVFSETIKILNRIESIEATAPETVEGQAPKTMRYSRNASQNNTAATIGSDALGRNDKVTIEKDGKTQELKWKKAKDLVETQGWKIIEKIMHELATQFKKPKIGSSSLETIFDDAPLNEQIRQIEAEIELDSFWDNNPNAQTIFQQLNQLKRKRDNIQAIKFAIANAETGLTLLEEDPTDNDMITEITDIIAHLASTIDQIEIECLLSHEWDNFNCIFTINSGAGGTDAQDWAEMLLRMYTRWFSQKEFTHELTEMTPGDEEGIKSATIMVKGPLLWVMQNEIGIHQIGATKPV